MQVHELFTYWDWAVIIGYLVLTTVIGHRMSGKQASIRDFFLGGRSLPWPAVSGSMIATEISGVTFIGVPAMLFAANGNFTYLQWAIGSILARFLVSFWFVRAFYEHEIFSPYDYIGRKLGAKAKQLTSSLFILGGILGQSVRLLTAAIPLQIVTGLSFEWSILSIGIFAIAWTLMGGMQTVIWTDVIQFFIFIFGGLFALGWIIHLLPGGWGEVWQVGTQFGRTKVFDFSWNPKMEYTFWVAIIAIPFQNLSAFGVDQLNAQRMFCCRSEGDAKKALIASSVGQLITVLMMLVGLALFAFYQRHGWNMNDAAQLELTANSVGQLVIPGQADRIFPIWIVREMPIGLKGLILAGIFAASISSLDSILAALSQTTLSMFYHPEKGQMDEETGQKVLRYSKILVVVWGLVLCLGAIGLNFANKSTLIPLAFGMTAYTVGPLLGIMMLALWGRGNTQGLILGTVLSVTLTCFFRNEFWSLLYPLASFREWLYPTLAKLPTYDLAADGKLVGTVFSGWLWPVTTLLTIACGLLGENVFPKRSK